jgi:hypothetical protein
MWNCHLSILLEFTLAWAGEMCGMMMSVPLPADVHLLISHVQSAFACLVRAGQTRGIGSAFEGRKQCVEVDFDLFELLRMKRACRSTPLVHYWRKKLADSALISQSGLRGDADRG